MNVYTIAAGAQIGRIKYEFAKSIDTLVKSKQHTPEQIKEYGKGELTGIIRYLERSSATRDHCQGLSAELTKYLESGWEGTTSLQAYTTQLGEMSRLVRRRINTFIPQNIAIDGEKFLRAALEACYTVIAEFPMLTSNETGKWLAEMESIFSRMLVPNPEMDAKLFGGPGEPLKGIDPFNVPSRMLSTPDREVLFQGYIVRQVYQHLMKKAMDGETTTYSEIAVRFNLPASGNQLGAVLSPILTKIFLFCVGNGQPHLTSLVVRKSGEDKGIPGGGFWDLLQEHTELKVLPNRPTRRQVAADLQNEVFSYWSKLGL